VYDYRCSHNSGYLAPLLTLIARIVDGWPSREHTWGLDRLQLKVKYKGERRMIEKILFIIFSLLVLVAAGCAVASSEPEAIEPEITPENEDDMPPTDAPPTDVSPTGVPSTDVSPTGAPELPSGEVPQGVFDSVVADMLSRSGGDRSAVQVLKSEAVEWPDGSLGCPQPGMMYTQAIVSGYHVILALGGDTYDYRLSDRGSFVLCQNPASDAPTGTVTE
jgi:hypothetical protein